MDRPLGLGEQAKVMTGRDLKVTFPPGEKHVIWESRDDRNPARLKERVKSLSFFNTLAMNVDGLKRIRVIDKSDEKRIKVSRAKGINLEDDSHRESVGTNREFYSTPLETRIEMMTTYLDMVATLNERDASFTDHKKDSIYLDKESKEITVVDTTGVIHRGAEAWSEWDRKPLCGLSPTLRSFLIRYSKDEAEGLAKQLSIAPKTLLDLISEENVASSHSARDLIKQITEWRDKSELVSVIDVKREMLKILRPRKDNHGHRGSFQYWLTRIDSIKNPVNMAEKEMIVAELETHMLMMEGKI